MPCNLETTQVYGLRHASVGHDIHASMHVAARKLPLSTWGLYATLCGLNESLR